MGLAELSRGQGQVSHAARLLGAAERLHALAGPGWLFPDFGVAYEQSVEAARTALGDTPFAAAWASGRVSPPEEMVTLALAVADDLARAADLPAPSGPTPVPASDLFGLSRRECEVLALLAQRLTNPEMAAALFLSARTVEAHVARIFDKLGVNSRREAAAAAARLGLV